MPFVESFAIIFDHKHLYGNSPNVIENIHLLCNVLLVISIADEVQKYLCLRTQCKRSLLLHEQTFTN